MVIQVEYIEIKDQNRIELPVETKPDKITAAEFDRIWTPEESEANYKMYKQVDYELEEKDGKFIVILKRKITGRIGFGYSVKNFGVKEL